MQDTISTHNTADTTGTNNFVYTGNDPIFVLPAENRDTNQITGFSDYVVKTLNNTLPPLKERESLFTNRTFVRGDMKMQRRDANTSYNWMYGIVFGTLIVYLVLLKYNVKRIGSIWRGEENRYLMLLPAVFLFMPLITLLGYLIVDYYNAFSYFSFITSSVVGIYFLIMCAIFVYCFLKYIFIQFFGALFRMGEICSHYNSIQTTFYVIDGIVLLPLIFLCLYLPEYTDESMLVITVAAFAILMLIRLFRSLYYVLKATKFSKVYLFFYLCTLEFVPLIIIFKLLSKY